MGLTIHVSAFVDPVTRVGGRTFDVRTPFATLTVWRAALEVAAQLGNDPQLDPVHRAAWLAAERFAVARNGRVVPDDAQPTEEVRDGDHLLLALTAGEPGTLALAGIGIAAALLGSVLSPRPKLAPPRSTDDAESRRYAFGRFSTDAIEGDPEPVVMGTRRYGGKVVAVLQGEAVDGSGDNRLRMLIDMSHGVVGRLGDRASDFDAVAHDAIAGIYLNDQPILNFPGCKVSGRMGTAGQAVLPSFRDSETPREVGVGGVVLRNTSGSERTGGSPSGEAYTFDTIDAVDAVVLRVRLSRGLFTTSATGQLEPRTVKYRERHRLQAGPGAWSGWTVFTVTQARQSEFYSSPRVALTAVGAHARHEVQVERVSVEPADALSVDELVWDQCVNVVAGSNTYPNYAVLALDLLASEQVQSVPRVSVDMDGIKCRVWDGVSPPSAPVYSTAFTNNPMALALEAITNTRWGGGALWADANVDLASLFDCWARCDALVPRSGGTAGVGTRKRFTFNYVFDSRLPFDEMLRTICRAARVTPVLAGNVWRFVMDDVQASPVEKFTDGSVALESDEPDAVAEFTYVREHREGGKAAPNRLVGQFENALAEYRPSSVAFPALGTEWLGSPLNEPVHEQAVRLDGITDPDQAASEIKYQTKVLRFRTREVEFVTSRPALSVQPGDRFDLAFQLPGWGVISGRVGEGSTTTEVVLDRTLTVVGGTTYALQVMHLDGTYAAATITLAAGVYPPGTPITISPALAAAPLEGAEYSVGQAGLEFKPFLCTRVALADSATLKWRVSGVEYNAQIYDDSVTNVTYPPYSSLRDLYSPPGPVTSLRAYERDGSSATGMAIKVVTLAYTQRPEDAQITASFRVFRRTIGTATWIVQPNVTFGNRTAGVDVTDLNQGYAFKVIAVSAWGSALSPNDPSVPEVVLAFGLSAEPPPPPTNLIATATSGNTYTLSWDAVEGATSYQVLFGGDTGTGMPHGGAEDCLVLARPTDTQLAGLELPPGRSCTFWVRSVGGNGRMSKTASVVTVASPATPGGQTIKQTKVFDFSTEGTTSNLTWDGTDGRLELTSAASPGTWTSPEVDPGSLSNCEVTFRPGTDNDAANVAINTFPLVVPSIEADQWGVVNGGTLAVGMLFPPYPDNRHSWLFEVRTHDGSAWGAWGAIAACAAVQRTCQKWQFRFTIARGAAPYRPAMRGLAVVLTH